MAIPKQKSVWDDKRNTSRVRPVPPDALPNALAALARLRASDPALVKWIEDGYPTLTEDEHVQRFGEPHPSRTRAR